MFCALNFTACYRNVCLYTVLACWMFVVWYDLTTSKNNENSLLFYFSCCFHSAYVLMFYQDVTCLLAACFFIARQYSSADVRYWYNDSVRLSVCNVLVLYRNGLTHHRTFFSISSLPSTKHLCKTPTPRPLRWRQIQVKYIHFAIFCQIEWAE